MTLKDVAPWEEIYDKPRQCIKKQRHYFADKGLYSQSYGFSSSHVQVWKLDHKEVRVLKNSCFQIVVPEESSMDCKVIKPVNSKRINPEYSLEGLILKLKLQYFGCLMRRADSLKKTLMLGKTEGRGRKGRQTMRWLDGINNLMDRKLSKLQEVVEDRGAWHATIHGVTKNWTQLSNWTVTPPAWYNAMFLKLYSLWH